jgi:uncharacterized protein RhaS with RHS repeats
LRHWTYDLAQNPVEAEGGRTTYTWNTGNRLLLIELPSGVRNTMSYRADGLRHRLVDTDGDKRMVWDSQGPTGYVDLVEEATE